MGPRYHRFWVKVPKPRTDDKIFVLAAEIDLGTPALRMLGQVNNAVNDDDVKRSLYRLL